MGPALLVVVALLSPVVLAAQESESISSGRLLYRVHCQGCHGEDGTGDGPMAEVLEIPPSDLTRLSRENDSKFPLDEVHEVIDGRREVRGHRTRTMPVWGMTFQDPDRDSNQEEEVQGRIRNLVRYLQSLQR
ncbi:MAG: cytochrome c [Thermoanaerobaculia bacterium]